MQIYVIIYTERKKGTEYRVFQKVNKMITVNEAKAMVEKYKEEQKAKIDKEVERLANLASDKIEEAARLGKTEIVFEVVDGKVKYKFINKFKEAGFDAYLYKEVSFDAYKYYDNETRVVIKW